MVSKAYKHERVTLCQDSACPPDETPADRDVAEEPIQFIAQEIECVGIKGLGAGEEPANKLSRAMAGVRQHDGPENPAVRRRDVAGGSERAWLRRGEPSALARTGLALDGDVARRVN
jgi:hypothetical protein